MTTGTTLTETQTPVPPADFDDSHIRENLRWGHLFWPGSTALTEAQIDDRVSRYRKSLERYRASGMKGNYLPDDLEVDSAWHAHQCDPVGYAEFCTRYFGGILAHTVTLCVCKLVELDQK
ncbi:hypothetical protein [Nocardia cyriacigeorgica]|jgi:hypothetical protein|uniref:hypothetical protein n=1 Tax=Nocardia cyriacigeorgica TaxID=135487 RepID=UPI0013D7CD74|nr:hypothetical protein [Nocardia cyriacigeorgica]MBF6454596.1 hypothetical protein [Nocardia cyriacigeorgica]MBF6479685.1 hypothetical protein [Nocardia cyriacigeorgica]MBF6552490.1 hypothetical protein [Nocardia cyriacigeorgica]NEW27210.1 hypothetical protein [Nocardia cyriacigeorgica]